MNEIEADRIRNLLDSVEKELEENERLQNEQDLVRRQLFREDEHEEEDNLPEEDADDEIDNVEVRDRNSDSEESAESEDEGARVNLTQDPSSLEYVGKNGETRWNYFPHPNASRGRARRRNIVTHLPGPIRQARNVTTPLESWKLFFPDNVLEEIVIFTNIWIRINREKYSRERDAGDTTLTEIKAVFGLLYLAGTMKCSHTNLKDLWSTDGTGIERFRVTMNIRRFQYLLRALRFDNVTDRNERKANDKMAPIRDIFEGFVARCRDNYSLSEYATIDEMLEAFRGKCRFRQYIPNKPAKYGIKIFTLTDARTFYTYNMEVYTGKQNPGPFQLNNSAKSIVERLIQPISNSGRNITTDNWYTSVPLAETLLRDHRLTLVGTIRKNKTEIPPFFIEVKNRPVTSSVFGFKEDLVLVSYAPKKNKVVLLLSTMHRTDKIDVDSGEAHKPEILTFYNLTKGGVDVVDELKQLYSVARVSNRWSLTLFYSLLNIAGVNAYIILKSNTEVGSRRMFLKDLTMELCKDFLETRLTMRSIRRDVRVRIRELLGKEPDGDIQRRDPQFPGRCSFCSSKKNRKTKTTCTQCGTFVCREHTVFSCVSCAGLSEEEV